MPLLRAALLLALVCAPAGGLLADGCFVFKWDKKTDINEPTQKAIILHDAGREDLLLQVKFEGAIDDFGWLVPVPTIPKVEKGSMSAFYELSELTQRRFGSEHDTVGALTVLGAQSKAAEPVKVIEIKTVGAYEISVLAAQEAGSLERWLKAHGYAIPQGKSEFLDEYIRKGWYFVATKINVKELAAPKVAGEARHPDSSAGTRRAVKQQLRSGELHPLLISFDTPKCIFPLKISAMSGKPAEVSLYVLSPKPLLNPIVFDEACQKLDQRCAEWVQGQPKREEQRLRSYQNLRTMGLAYQMYNGSPGTRGAGTPRKGWSPDDMRALVIQAEPAPPRSLDEDFYARAEEALQCMEVKPEQLVKSAPILPRLKDRSWFLTKQARTFAPAEMRDLEFQPAVPALAATLGRPAGLAAARVLAQLGPDAVSLLLAALESGDPKKRLNTLHGFENLADRRVVDPLMTLLRDKSPQVRLQAVRVADSNWDPRLREPLLALFRDPTAEIRSEACATLAAHEGRERVPAYVALLKDADPNVQVCALGVLLRLDRNAIPAEALSKMVSSGNPDLQSYAAQALWQLSRGDMVPRADLLRLLSSPRMETVAIAMRLIEGNGRVQPEVTGSEAAAREARQRARDLTSAEATPLATHSLGLIRLLSLKVLRRNADAAAVELTLPMLRDTNAIIRSRAFETITAISGQKVSESDPAKWEQWWKANKATFKKAQG